MRWHKRNKLYHCDKLAALFAISAATGSFAKSSVAPSLSTPLSSAASTIAETPIHPQRTQKREVPLRQDCTELERGKKKPQIAVDSNAFDLITSLMKGQTERRLNRVELAVQLLDNQY